MRTKLALPLLATCLAVGLQPGVAWAQDSGQDLSGLEKGELRSALQLRYDAGLAATENPAIVNANDPRYLWASETKVQCGIALGYLKANRRDANSIGKCQNAYERMQYVPPPPAAPPPPPPRATCPQQLPGMIFFDFDSAVPPADARQTAEFVARNYGPCGWRGLTVTGHADRSGSDSYNIGLSRRRAEAVAGMLTSMGVPANAVATEARGESQPRVPTADGVREAQNRRVEITVR